MQALNDPHFSSVTLPLRPKPSVSAVEKGSHRSFAFYRPGLVEGGRVGGGGVGGRGARGAE